MNTRAFSLALIIAGIAMFMVYVYIDEKTAEMTNKYGQQVTVVIATKDIEELELIDDSKVTTKSVPQEYLQPGHFKEIKELENTIATVPILKGEQITKPRVTYPGVKTGLSRQVNVGKRAISINVTERQAVGKLIKPGDRVDVLSALDYGGGRKDMQKVNTVLQDVLILSTGMSMTNSLPIFGVKTPTEIKTMKANTYTKYNTVTLELDPFQVQKLVHLLNFSGAPLYLSLRNNSDKEQIRIKSTRLFDLLEDEDSSEAKTFFQAKYESESKGGR